jgi:hypothetical protein
LDLHLQHILTAELFGFGTGRRAALHVPTSKEDEVKRVKSGDFDREKRCRDKGGENFGKHLPGPFEM